MKLLIFTVIITLNTVAVADPTPTAEDLYTEGQAAYDRGDYAIAIARWQHSYQLSGANGLLFNVAQALRLSGDCAGAIATYRRFMRADTDPTSNQHRLADEFMRELGLTCPPPSLPLPPSDQDHGLKLVPELRRPNPVGKTLRIVGLATSGVGALSIAVGIGVGHHGQTIGTDVTTGCAPGCDWSAQESRDATGRRDVAIGYTLDGIGAAAILGGAIAYYLGDRRDTISVSPHEGGAAVTWIRSW